jgi:CheY-like chemotaxis protein
MPHQVLVIDDDHLIRQMVRDFLEGTDYVVLEAVDGMEGLALAERHQPEVILLDLVMPGIDGYEVCQGLKENPTTKAIPVIFVTSSVQSSLNHLAYTAGAVACVPKPFRREALLATVALALNQVKGRVKAVG